MILSDMSDAGERTGSSNDELKVDPGNPDNIPITSLRRHTSWV